MSEWREWNGGICPVDVEVYIYVKHRSGWVSNGSAKAGLHRWDHGRGPQSNLRENDIIAFMVDESR